MTKQSVIVRRNPSEIWTPKNLTTFGLQPVTTLFERETECEYIHSTGNCPLFQMPYLANSYDSSVVSYLTWKLGVTYFFNYPVYALFEYYAIFGCTKIRTCISMPFKVLQLKYAVWWIPTMHFLTADLLFSQLIVEMYASQSMHLF